MSTAAKLQFNEPEPSREDLIAPDAGVDEAELKELRRRPRRRRSDRARTRDQGRPR